MIPLLIMPVFNGSIPHKFERIHKMSDNLIFENLIRQKNSGSLILKRILFILGYLALGVLIYSLLIAFCPLIVLIPFLLLGTAIIAGVVFFTWKFTVIEYEYIIAADRITFTVIYGKLLRKKTLELNLKSFSEVGFYDPITAQRMENVTVNHDYIYISSMTSPDICYALFDRDKEKCILYFEAPDKALDIIKKYNPSAFRTAALETKKYEMLKKKPSENETEQNKTKN